MYPPGGRRGTPRTRVADERRSARRHAGGTGARDNRTMVPAPPQPLSDAELQELQQLLDALPPPLEPLDVSMLDGYLVGVLLQPRPVPAAQWLRYVADSDGRAAPADAALARVHALALRRHAELAQAIERRDWFDPWVYELDADASPSETVLPWVAGFALALTHFDALMAGDEAALLEPLAVLYQHLDPEDLDDADALLAEIDTLEPPRDLAEAVEGLVNSTLRLADVSRPRRAPPPARAGRPRAGTRRARGRRLARR